MTDHDQIPTPTPPAPMARLQALSVPRQLAAWVAYHASMTGRSRRDIVEDAIRAYALANTTDQHPAL